MEHEILGKTLGVAFDLLVQALGRNAVDDGELAIEDDALAAEDQNDRSDALDSR